MIKTKEIATTLLTAFEHSQPISSIETEDTFTEDTFYDVQHEYIQRRIEDFGEEVKGYKISLTNKGLQKVFQTNSPVYGTLTDKAVVENGMIHKTDFMDPLLEAELMFLVTEDISANAEPSEIIEKTVIAPGLELPDSRIKDWFPHISIGELIMDNAVTGKVAVGKPIKIQAPTELENITLSLYLNDEKVVEGDSSFVLENPINAVMWLNQKLASQGKGLTKGMVISSGTFISPVPLTAGTYRAVFDHFGEIKIQVIEK